MKINKKIKNESIGDYLINEYGKNAIDIYWGKNNTTSPFDISVRSDKRIQINCIEKPYHGEYEIKASKFSKGQRCGYCYGNFKVHPLESWAQFNIDRFGEDFLVKYWDYEKNDELGIYPYNISPKSLTKVWVYCQKKEYHGSYEVAASHFSNGRGCPYCRGIKLCFEDSLGMKHPDSLLFWSDKNILSPYDYTQRTSKYVWFKCHNNKHDDYYRRITHAVDLNFQCPMCVKETKESRIEKKVKNYIKKLGYNIKCEYECDLICVNPETKYKLPYDIQIPSFGLYIEVHGVQHEKPTKFHSVDISDEQALQNLKDLQYRDAIKRDFVLSNGYHYLAIWYYDIQNSDNYKTLIDNKIAEILLQQQQQQQLVEVT